MDRKGYASQTKFSTQKFELKVLVSPFFKPDYGAKIAQNTGQGAIRLMQSDVPTNGACAVVRYVQAGIDWFTMLENGFILSIPLSPIISFSQAWSGMQMVGIVLEER